MITATGLMDERRPVASRTDGLINDVLSVDPEVNTDLSRDALVGV